MRLNAPRSEAGSPFKIFTLSSKGQEAARKVFKEVGVIGLMPCNCTRMEIKDGLPIHKDEEIAWFVARPLKAGQKEALEASEVVSGFEIGGEHTHV